MNDVLTQDQIHSLFINLNKLADFQRRFLIGVESNASLAPEQQRFGHLFLLSVRSNVSFRRSESLLDRSIGRPTVRYEERSQESKGLC
jgi:hypothetical protein